VLRILCVRFSSIGDVLLTTPLVRALHRRHPEAELYFVTKRALAPLVVENPHLTSVLTLAPDERITDLARRLRALGPTHGLDLHGSLRSAALRWLVPSRWAGYSKRKLARTALISTKINLYGSTCRCRSATSKRPTRQGSTCSRTAGRRNFFSPRQRART